MEAAGWNRLILAAESRINGKGELKVDLHHPERRRLSALSDCYW